MPLDVLYEDNHVLAVVKPAGVVTMGALPGVRTLLDDAREYVKVKYQKPGQVYLGIVSRLDGPVSGVVLLARTSKAADRLSEQFREREVAKTYWAIVSGQLRPPAGQLQDWMAEDERHRKMHAVAAGSPEAKEARLTYRVRQALTEGLELPGQWLEIELETGRKHQIRVQFSSRGHPIVGDRKYGSREKFAPGIALHARSVRFSHPVRDEEIELTAPLPASWRRWKLSEE